jgi:heptose I phosphotransferase
MSQVGEHGTSFWQRLFRGVCRTRARADWKEFAGNDWAQHIMQVQVTDQFHAKQGRSTGRWIVEDGGKRLAVFLKRHYRLRWWQGWLAMFWPQKGWSPAMQEWRNLKWARSQGLPVPDKVAVAEYIGPWGKLQSFLAIEELTGMLPLHEAIPQAARLLDASNFRRWKKNLTAELARLARALHDRCYFHKDLYLCHFFIPQADLDHLVDFRGRVHLIDLHRLAHHPWTRLRWQVKDLAQLLYSSEMVGVATRDRLLFWRLYQGQGPRSRWLEKLIRFKWRRYRGHNVKKTTSRER